MSEEPTPFLAGTAADTAHGGETLSASITFGAWPPDATAGRYPPMTPALFRQIFTAWADPGTYPDAMLQWFLDLGWAMVNCNWGAMQPMGQGLWAAHELYKLGPGGLTQTPDGSTKLSGGLEGVTSSKSVGPVSVSFDTGLTSIEHAGPYNASIYGQQYYEMALLYGTGPIQVGPAVCPPWGSGATAWPGPGYPWLSLGWG